VRILFCSDNFPPETNAPASRTFEHAREWVRSGHAVEVLTCAPNFPEGRVHAGHANGWRRRTVESGIDVLRVKTFIAPNRGFGLRTLDYLSYLPAALLHGARVERPDIVVATSPQIFAALAGWALAKLHRVPFVFELRDLWPASIRAVGALQANLPLRLLERLELFLYREAAAIVAVSPAFRNDLTRRGIDPLKIHVVTNGVDLSHYSPRPRDPEWAARYGLAGRFVVGYCGTLGLAHGLENVLAAAERLHHREELRFLFAGTGAARERLQSEAQRRRLSNVVFLDPVPKHDMPRLWSLLDVALVHLRATELFETVLPSKIFEAFGMGLPVLYAGPRGEATALIEREGAGVCVRPEDPGGLAAAAEQLLSDSEQTRRCARAARAAAPAYDRRALALRMQALLEAVVEQGSVPPDLLVPMPRRSREEEALPRRQRRRMRAG
jgi:glycosyltransferase involved in cell wall biosynthesis